MKKKFIIVLILVVACICIAPVLLKINLNSRYQVGQAIDSLTGVIVYYNGGVGNSSGRNLAPDGYNLGIRYQCVEFVKRYYYEHLHHKMPNAMGHAKDFFDKKLADGQLNQKRNLIQYRNGGTSKPDTGDIIVFSATWYNRYGHVAIISKASEKEIEMIQQNPGPFGKSREVMALINDDRKWTVKNRRVLGWLRKE